NGVTNERVSAASVMIKNGTQGTFSDDKGNIHLRLTGNFPVTLLVSSIGFEPQEVIVTTSAALLDVKLKPTIKFGQEVVVSATRTPTSFLESPVSVERLSISSIRNAATPGFYESIAHLKGVDLTTSGLQFQTVSTRG